MMNNFELFHLYLLPSFFVCLLVEKNILLMLLRDYFRLSGISPFAGDDVMETYSYIGSVEYDFECEEFSEISDEAIDFIEKLLLRRPGYV